MTSTNRLRHLLFLPATVILLAGCGALKAHFNSRGTPVRCPATKMQTPGFHCPRGQTHRTSSPKKFLQLRHLRNGIPSMSMFFLYIPPCTSEETIGMRTWTTTKSIATQRMRPCEPKQALSTLEGGCTLQGIGKPTLESSHGKTAQVGPHWNWRMKMCAQHLCITSNIGIMDGISFWRDIVREVGIYAGSFKNSSMGSHSKNS